MFVVYHDIRTEARTQEILECATKMSNEIYYVSYSEPFDIANINMINTGKRNYIKFIINAIKAIIKVKPPIIILHDNYCAFLLCFIKIFLRDTTVVYDSSELYITIEKYQRRKHIAYLLMHFEKKYLCKADVVIAANYERALIMKDYFKLKEVPIIFNNIHKIEDPIDIEQCNSKYGHLFKDNSFRILYAGGISRVRQTYELAEAVGKLGSKYSLIVIGLATDDEKSNFSKMLLDKEYSNILYLGYLSRSEMRYILQNVNASVSAFAQDIPNNKYCASGKLYESLFEGVPVITSENPPLYRICNEYGIGVSNDNFAEAILQLENKYEEYCNNVNKYIDSINFNERVNILANLITERIS
jgi:glycosyltransferase involved in cell wall biosynthesis